MTNHKRGFSLFLIVYILFGVYCFILGDSGWLQRKNLIKEKKQILKQISVLEEENKELKDLYERYKNEELIKEEAVKAGYIENGDKLLFIKDTRSKTNIAVRTTKKKEGFAIDVEHLRIFWVVISVMVIIFFFIKRNKQKEENF